ncbi:hypothetical protein [Tangfeifania diversioriginum]|uniref:hypothetical protein n=1 Tax=Tangfeifania diversioriginum TaxID=1168035 RepID=UPI0009336837|nr:hypothetical protein [Tangfeifania diversioriginum]
MTGRIAFAKQLLILGYQITYAQHLEKSKFGGFTVGYSNCHSFNQQKKQRYQSLFFPSAALAKILKMVVMNAGGNE